MNKNDSPVKSAQTAAEALLMSLKANGIDYLFANAGNDFAPIIEALSNPELKDKMPQPITCMHETAAVSMAHGYYLMTGKMQASMVHVHVGLANALSGLINAHGDNIPLFMLAGRTPVTEHDRVGARLTPVQYGQEVFDQNALIREFTKWEYELRYPEQASGLISRAVSLAMAEPRDPVFLGLPREPLLDPLPEHIDFEEFPVARVTTAYPDPSAIEQVAEIMANAKNPLIVTERGDPEGRVGENVAQLADDNAFAVVEFAPSRNVMPSRHPMMLGYQPGPALKEADVILVVDASAPWVEKFHRPEDGKTIIHVGPDPLFNRQPVRSYQTDMAISGDTAVIVEQLNAALKSKMGDTSERYAQIKAKSEARWQKVLATVESDSHKSPLTGEFISNCVSQIMDEDAVCINELGTMPGYMDLKGPNRYFFTPYSGALGWGMTAALGAQLADRDRLVIACVGDGSYVFANPIACHQIAEAQQLPILTVVKNNGVWNAVRRSTLAVHDDGHAANAEPMPLMSLHPSPNYVDVARANRAHIEKVERAEDLLPALRRAVDVIRTEKRQAFVEVITEVSDSH